MARRKNKVLDSDSPKDEKLDDFEVVSDNGKYEAPSIDSSPLLSTGRIEREYTSSTSGSGMGGTESNNSTSQMNTGAKRGEPLDKSQFTELNEPKEPIYKIQPDDNVPIQDDFQTRPPAVMGMDGQIKEDGDKNAFQVPEDLAAKASKSTAHTITDLYKDIMPELLHEIIKLNEKEIKKHVSKGDLMDQAYDEVKGHNRDNKERLKERADLDAKMLRKPLARFFEIKNISTSPLGELIMAVLAVAALNFFLIKNIKSENNDLLERLTKNIIKAKQGVTESEKEPELTEAEEL